MFTQQTHNDVPTAVGVDLDALNGKENHRRALIVDDDPDAVDLMKIIIRNAGIDVVGAFSGFEALQKCADVQPHVILVDLMMPGMDGWQTYLGLRQMTNAPVIMVSANGKKENVVESLQMGFDDYMIKPFFPPELVARVNAVMRRVSAPKPVRIRVFPEIQLTIDFDNKEVILKNKPIQLTSREFAVLGVLATNAPGVVKYEDISAAVWGDDTNQHRNRIKYLIYLLRQKIEDDPKNPELVINREGFGYKLQTSSC
jgi:two-component system KDP operon response regulator KdpE